MSTPRSDPAFSRTGSNWRDGSGTMMFSSGQRGMSIRAYMVAHAPPPPDWFVPVMQSECPEPVWAEPYDGASEKTITNHAERSAWRIEYAMQRSVQWPLRWADHVIDLMHRQE